MSKEPEFFQYPQIHSGFSLGAHCGLLKEAVWKLKYEQRKVIAKTFSEMLAARLQSLSWRVDLICAVPMAPVRFRARLFNPAEILGIMISKTVGRPYRQALSLKRAVRHQVGLGRKDRLANLQGAFKIKEQAMIEQKSILLVDDVTTTGATLSECAKTLLEGGASMIRAVTISKEALL